MPENPPIPQPWEHKNVMRVLSSHTPPAGRFDPAGPWEHTYNVHFLNIRPARGAGRGAARAAAAGRVQPDGILKITSASRDGGVELNIDSTALMSGDRTTARIRCRRDLLGTPESWETSFTNALESAKPLVTFTTRGSVAGGVLMRDGKPVRGAKRLSTYTSDWSLFEAVQRLTPQKLAAPAAFDLVEYLDVVRPGQTLKHRGSVQVSCAGKSVATEEYLQYGEGIIPIHYYVDASGRLIMVLETRRLFVLVEETVG